VGLQPSPDFALLFGALADEYDRVVPFFETFAAHLVDAVELRAGERALDLACGTGRCLQVAARAVGREGQAVGIDFAPSMTEIAARYAAEAELLQVALGAADAGRLPLRTASFDALTCGFGVFFFPDPDAALRECHRVLRPGGRFAATTFTSGTGGYPWAPEVAAAVGRGPGGEPSPVLNHGGLEVALVAAGFVDVRSMPVVGRFRFDDVDHYLAWCRSTGIRRVLDGLTPEELETYRLLSAAFLEGHAIDGGYEFVQSVQVTVATSSRESGPSTLASSA
jgi:ubiquinone/menaquinone biosynthesis C-methylase UbiE